MEMFMLESKVGWFGVAISWLVTQEFTWIFMKFWIGESVSRFYDAVARRPNVIVTSLQ